MDYDRVASEYDQRYPTSQYSERGQALLGLARQLNARRVLEAGCGTGFWLSLLHTVALEPHGLDFSAGMLQQARKRPAPLRLARGSATGLPYENNTFDLVYCVDAVHHFGDSLAFIREAHRSLHPGGALAIIGHDPHGGENHWYVYDHFENVRATDLARYPSGQSLTDEMRAAGFQAVTTQTVEHIVHSFTGREVFDDPYLKHSASSQLALLDEDAYQRGLNNIAAAIAHDEHRIFRTDLRVKMFLGYTAPMGII